MGKVSVANVWDALKEFKKVVNASKSIQAEFQAWRDRVIQFIVKGGENCYIKLQNGKMIIEKGKKDNPELTFTALDGNLVKFITGQTDYTSLDIMGSVIFEGNEADKNRFIAAIGLFISALLGESDEFDEVEN